jgi:hypothetical protein
MAFTQIQPAQNRSGLVQWAVSGETIPDAATRVHLRVLMNQTTRDNPASAFQFDAYYSEDGGATWLHHTGGTWRGGSGGFDKEGMLNPPPAIIFEGESLERMKNALMRFDIAITGTVRLGAEAEILTA